MNKQQAQQFVSKLFDEVWRPRNADKVKDFYHKDVSILMGKQQAGYDDIINRVHFIKNEYREVISEIDDVLVDGDKITARLTQTCYGKGESGTEVYCGLFIYQIEDDKVKKAWAALNAPFDYFEQA